MNRLVPCRSVAAFSCSLLAGALLLMQAYPERANAAPGPIPGASMPPPPAPQAPPILSVNDPRNTLHLTADQQQKLIAERLKLRTEGLSLLADKSLTRDQQNQKFAALQAASMQNMRAMLTPTQRAKADQQEQVGKRIMAMRQQAGQQYQALKRQLSATVTPDQKAKLVAIDTSTRKQGAAIQASTTLSTAQKQAKLTRLSQTYRESFNATLNKPVQKSLMQRLILLQTQEQAAEVQAAHQ